MPFGFGISSLSRAILILLVGVAAFDAMGVIVRMLGGTYPILQISVLRNLFGVIPAMIILLAGPGLATLFQLRSGRHWLLIFLRAASVLMAQMSFYFALTKIEFATASALGFTTPFFIALLSIPVLGHMVGPVRMAAILIGFAGVVTILKPFSDGFTIWMLLPVFAAFFYALSSILVRLFPAEIPSATIQIGQQAITCLMGLVLLLTIETPVAIASLHDAGLFVLMGVFGGIGVMGLVVSYRMVEPSSLAPFEYFGIPVSFVLGYIFFQEAPFGTLFPGVLFIVGAGILIILREKRAEQRARIPE